MRGGRYQGRRGQMKFDDQVDTRKMRDEDEVETEGRMDKDIIKYY